MYVGAHILWYWANCGCRASCICCNFLAKCLYLPVITQNEGITESELAALLPWTPSVSSPQGHWCHSKRNKRDVRGDVFPYSLSASPFLSLLPAFDSPHLSLLPLQLLKFPWRSLGVVTESTWLSLSLIWCFLFFVLCFFVFFFVSKWLPVVSSISF